MAYPGVFLGATSWFPWSFFDEKRPAKEVGNHQHKTKRPSVNQSTKEDKGTCEWKAITLQEIPEEPNTPRHRLLDYICDVAENRLNEAADEATKLKECSKDIAQTI